MADPCEFKETIQELSKQMDKVYPMVTGVNGVDTMGYKDLCSNVVILADLINGNEKKGIIGLRTTLKLTEEAQTKAEREQRRRDAILTGIAIGLGLQLAQTALMPNGFISVILGVLT